MKLFTVMLKSLVLSLLLAASAQATDKVDINTATAAELDQVLVNVGPAKAQAIVDHRQANGPFKSVEELALVIDTSYSTSGELVRAFLAETYTLLKGRENFFHRMNLHLIQADNAIRQDLLIRNEDELIHAMNHFELRGGGGTDFRPAFEYVNQLCAEKKFSNLRGLLYFTDGMGTYPARRPAYDTAFLFLFHKVHGGLAIVYLTCFAGFAGEIQNTFGDCGFSRINMGGNTYVSEFC